MAKTVKKEVVKSTEVVVATPAQLPAMMGQYVGLGDENVTAQDIALPMLFLAQALSEVVKRREAFDGDFYVPVTGDVFGEALRVVPISFRTDYCVWVDGKLKGGFRGSFSSQEDAVLRARQVQEEEGEAAKVVRTPVHILGIVSECGTYLTPAAFPMAKAEQASRAFNAKLQFIRPKGPRFARAWTLARETKSNAKGEWFVPTFSNPQLLDDTLFNEALGLYQAIASANTVTYDVGPEGGEEAPDSEI